jgi:Calcineurin-like phosphoesterase
MEYVEMTKLRHLKTIALFTAIPITLTSQLSAEPWTFGLMSDTQWGSNTDGENPNTVSVGIIKQLNKEFINHNVKFVVQVGDLVDKYSSASFDTRAEAADELLTAGIGFFPLRGNHESSFDAANYFSYAFPQTCGDINTFGAVNFQSPSTNLGCLSYSFDYNNVHIVMLDQFTRKDNSGINANNNIIDQQEWINSTLSGRPAGTHAFVFSHKNLIGQNHTDMLFGTNPGSNAAAQNSLFKALYSNGVRYSIGGHDHMHHRSIVLSPDNRGYVNQIICSSNSYKFYTPLIPANDTRYNTPERELPIEQELYTIGYYIFTVDGPKVTVDYYSSLNGCSTSWESTADCDLKATPRLSFVKRETFGYSLNGKEFIVKPGDELTIVADTCKINNSQHTVAAIISGTNLTSNKLYDGRNTVQDINTGWEIRSDIDIAAGVVSDQLTLWGMQDVIGNKKCDTYVLSMSYDTTLRGPLSIYSKDSLGNWNKTANNNNVSNESHFVIGPYRQTFELGTYGIDPATHTVWAVVDHDGDFTVMRSSDGDQDGDNDIDTDDIRIVSSLKNKPASLQLSADLDNDGRITILDVRKLYLISAAK